jgi:hypothetical protein
MSCFQIGSVDRAHIFAQCGATAALVDHFRDATQQVVLGKHARRLILGSREHQLPVEGRGFIFQRLHIYMRRVVDHSDLP